MASTLLVLIIGAAFYLDPGEAFVVGCEPVPPRKFVETDICIGDFKTRKVVCKEKIHKLR